MRFDDEGVRRRVYEVDGVEGYITRLTAECTGCTEYDEGYHLSGPCGCDECGYTGKRRWSFWTPFVLSEDPRLKPHREEVRHG